MKFVPIRPEHSHAKILLQFSNMSISMIRMLLIMGLTFQLYALTEFYERQRPQDNTKDKQ